MTKFMTLTLALTVALLSSGVGFANSLDLKTMAGTISFEPSVNEAKAIEIGRFIAKNKNARRVYIRQYKTKDIWAINIEWSHDGSHKAFHSTLKFIESSIEKKFGKNLIKGKNIASSITWIKK